MGLGEIGASCFNTFAGGLKTIEGCVFYFGPVGKVVSFVGDYFKKCSVGEAKNFYINPVAFLNPAVEFLDLDSVSKGWRNFSKEAVMVKTFVSTVDVFAKMPGTWKQLSTKIGEEDAKEKYSREFVIEKEEQYVEGKASAVTELFKQESPYFSINEILCKKIRVIFELAITTGYLIKGIGRYQENPSLGGRALPWVWAVGGGYIGLQGIWEEVTVLKSQWEYNTNRKELNLSYSNLAVSVAYLAYSILGGLKIYFGEKTSKTFNTLQFAGLAAVTVLPIVQGCAKSAVEKLHKEVFGSSD